MSRTCKAVKKNGDICGSKVHKDCEYDLCGIHMRGQKKQSDDHVSTTSIEDTNTTSKSTKTLKNIQKPCKKNKGSTMTSRDLEALPQNVVRSQPQPQSEAQIKHRDDYRNEILQFEQDEVSNQFNRKIFESILDIIRKQDTVT